MNVLISFVFHFCCLCTMALRGEFIAVLCKLFLELTFQVYAAANLLIYCCRRVLVGSFLFSWGSLFSRARINELYGLSTQHRVEQSFSCFGVEFFMCDCSELTLRLTLSLIPLLTLSKRGHLTEWYWVNRSVRISFCSFDVFISFNFLYRPLNVNSWNLKTFPRLELFFLSQAWQREKIARRQRKFPGNKHDSRKYFYACKQFVLILLWKILNFNFQVIKSKHFPGFLLTQKTSSENVNNQARKRKRCEYKEM